MLGLLWEVVIVNRPDLENTTDESQSDNESNHTQHPRRGDDKDLERDDRLEVRS